MVRMEVGAALERVREIAAVRADEAAGPGDIEGALRAVSQLRSWLAASDAALTARLAPQVSFPERTIAECTRSSLNDAAKAKERSDTLDAVPSFADALDAASVTPAHVDAITRAGKSLDADQRTELFERVADLVDMASAATVEEFRRRLSLVVRSIQADDDMARLERQRRATRLRTWTDAEGMWRFDGRFDPVLGVSLAAKLDAAVEALFAEAVPETCPSDPVEKQAHLRALAWARLASADGAAGARPGRPEYVVVIDASQTDGAGGPLVDWGIPVEIPHRVLAEMTEAGDVARSWCATGSSSIRRAPSIWAGRPDSPVVRSVVHCGRSTRRAPSRAARCVSIAASCTTSCGGGTVAAPICTTCSRSVPAITHSCTARTGY